LILKYSALLSRIAFNFNSRRYITSDHRDVFYGDSNAGLSSGLQSYYGNHNGELMAAILRDDNDNEYSPSLAQMLKDAELNSIGDIGSLEAGAYTRPLFSST
jgi:hypothetical protein